MILVFGKTGQLAMELQRMGDVVALGRNEADLTDPYSCVNTIQKYMPTAVINAAAYTDVDMAEAEAQIATVINGDSPTAMAETCADMGIPLIHISTDYVFAGMGDDPWSPNDPTAPKNAYGFSKLAGEIGVCASGAIHAIIRTSWVVSAQGENFVKTMLSLSETRSELNVVADQIGGPTPARDLAITCLKIADQLRKDPSKSGIYHFSGFPDVSWAEFATEIFGKAGRTVTVYPIKTADYPTTAVRPLNSRMECRSIEQTFCGVARPDWRSGLVTILKELEVK